jgi:hypothetical protein
MNLDDLKTLRRCYSIYLWAFTVSISGGVVNFDLDDEALDELGPEAVFAHQQAAAQGARQPKLVSSGAPEPWSWSRFYKEFEIERLEVDSSFKRPRPGDGVEREP